LFLSVVVVQRFRQPSDFQTFLLDGRVVLGLGLEQLEYVLVHFVYDVYDLLVDPRLFVFQRVLVLGPLVVLRRDRSRVLGHRLEIVFFFRVIRAALSFQLKTNDNNNNNNSPYYADRVSEKRYGTDHNHALRLRHVGSQLFYPALLQNAGQYFV